MTMPLSRDLARTCLAYFGQAVSRKPPFWTGKIFCKEFSILTFLGNNQKFFYQTIFYDMAGKDPTSELTTPLK